MRLLKFIIAVQVLILLVIGVVVIAARNQPPLHPLAPFQFDRCGDRACFMGIRPGETTFAEAKALLLAKGGREVRPDDMAIDVKAFEVHVLSFNASPNVTAIDVRLNLQPGTVITMNDLLPDLSAFLEAFGPPCAVYHIATAPEVELIYPFMRLSTQMDDERISITSAAANFSGTFMIAAPNPEVCDPKEVGPMVPWRGFTTLDFYRAHGLSDN